MRVATGFTKYRGGELAADRIIHTIGNFSGVVGSAMLVGIAAGVAERPIFLASLVYSICLLTMLGSLQPRLQWTPKSVPPPARSCCDLFNDRRYLHPIHDMPTARRLGDRDDCRNLDGRNHRSRHEADLSTWSQAKFDCCLPGPGLDDPAGGATHAWFARRSDGAFDRSWGRALFPRRRLSPLADAALPQRNMAQLRAGCSQLSLRSYSARRSLLRSGGIYRCLFAERRRPGEN